MFLTAANTQQAEDILLQPQLDFRRDRSQREISKLPQAAATSLIHIAFQRGIRNLPASIFFTKKKKKEPIIFVNISVPYKLD